MEPALSEVAKDLRRMEFALKVGAGVDQFTSGNLDGVSAGSWEVFGRYECLPQSVDLGYGFGDREKKIVIVIVIVKERRRFLFWVYFGHAVTALERLCDGKEASKKIRGQDDPFMGDVVEQTVARASQYSLDERVFEGIDVERCCESGKKILKRCMIYCKIEYGNNGKCGRTHFSPNMTTHPFASWLDCIPLGK